MGIITPLARSLVLLVAVVTHAQDPPLGEPDATASLSTQLTTTPQRQPGKLIEWSAVEPTTAFMREYVRTMEQLPFDGLIFHLKTNDNVQMVWNMWSDTPFTVDQFSREIADLEATKFERFTERFLRCNVTPGNIDWSDEMAWKVVTGNFRTAAQIVRRSGCRGIMFDTEQYDHVPFSWPHQTREERDAAAAKRAESRDADSQPDKKPVAVAVPPEVYSLVRQRGREWIRAINSECPDITILISYAYRSAQPTEGESFRVYGYELIPAFLDGVLEAASDGTRIVDAWEYSYPYRSRAEFEKGRRTIKEDSLRWTAVPAEYSQHVTAGFGLWMDFNVRGYEWHPDNVTLNYNTPLQFRQNLDDAFELTDEYVWIYSGQAKWWSHTELPDEYRQAVEDSREAARGQKTVDGDVSK